MPAFTCSHELGRSQQIILSMVIVLLVGALGGCASAAPKMAQFDDLLAKGLEYFNAGDLDRAEPYFELAVQSIPRHPYPHYYLGIIYTERGEAEMAVVAFERAVELEPTFHEALYNLGTIHLERRELTAAIALLERSLAINPDHVPTYNNLGKAYYLAGYPEMAGAAYEEALTIDPDNRVALESLMLLARSAGADDKAAEYRGRLERSASRLEE